MNLWLFGYLQRNSQWWEQWSSSILQKACKFKGFTRSTGYRPWPTQQESVVLVAQLLPCNKAYARLLNYWKPKSVVYDFKIFKAKKIIQNPRSVQMKSSSSKRDCAHNCCTKRPIQGCQFSFALGIYNKIAAESILASVKKILSRIFWIVGQLFIDPWTSFTFL